MQNQEKSLGADADAVGNDTLVAAPKRQAHTPGPWGIEKGCDEFEIAPAADIARDDWSREIAMTANQNIADAHLIAAAPELLDALKALITEAPTADGPHATYERAHAAIAKAEGKQS